MADNAATIKLSADKSELAAALKGAVSEVNGFGSKVVSVFASLNIAGMALKAFDWAKGLVMGAAKTEEANVRLKASFESTGNMSGFTSDQILSMTKRIHDLQFVSKSAAKEAAVMMSEFQNVRGDNFQRALELSADASKKWGVQMSEASKLVGSAINDPMTGMEKLKEKGIVFTEQQKQQVNAMLKAGKGAEVQAMMLDRLQQAVGGVAAGMGGTFNARMERFYEKMEGVSKVVGGVLLGAVEKVLPLIEALADAFDEYVVPAVKSAMEVIQPWIDAVESELQPVLVGLWNVCKTVFTEIGKVAVSLYNDYIAPAFAWMSDAVGGWSGVVEGAKATVAQYIEIIVAEFTAFQFAAEKLWGSVKPIFEGIGEVVSALWTDYVAPSFEGMSGSIASWRDTVRSILSTFVDVAIGAFSAVETVLANFGDTMALVGVSVALSIVKIYENAKYYFGTVIPELLRWFCDNWRDAFTDVLNYMTTVTTNAWTNIKDFWESLKTLATGGGFAFKWTNLEKGFTSTLKELPTIVARERGTLERELEEEAGRLGNMFSKRFDEIYKKNKDSALAQIATNLSTVANAIYGKGSPADAGKGKDADAKPKPSDVRAPTNFTTRPDKNQDAKAEFVSLEDMGKRIQATAASNKAVDVAVKTLDEMKKEHAKAEEHRREERETWKAGRNFWTGVEANTKKTADKIDNVGTLQ